MGFSKALIEQVRPKKQRERRVRTFCQLKDPSSLQEGHLGSFAIGYPQSGFSW